MSDSAGKPSRCPDKSYISPAVRNLPTISNEEQRRLLDMDISDFKFERLQIHEPGIRTVESPVPSNVSNKWKVSNLRASRQMRGLDALNELPQVAHPEAFNWNLFAPGKPKDDALRQFAETFAPNQRGLNGRSSYEYLKEMESKYHLPLGAMYLVITTCCVRTGSDWALRADWDPVNTEFKVKYPRGRIIQCPVDRSMTRIKEDFSMLQYFGRYSLDIDATTKKLSILGPSVEKSYTLGQPRPVNTGREAKFDRLAIFAVPRFDEPDFVQKALDVWGFGPRYREMYEFMLKRLARDPVGYNEVPRSIWFNPAAAKMHSSMMYYKAFQGAAGEYATFTAESKRVCNHPGATLRCDIPDLYHGITDLNGNPRNINVDMVWATGNPTKDNAYNGSWADEVEIIDAKTWRDDAPDHKYYDKRDGVGTIVTALDAGAFFLKKEAAGSNYAVKTGFQKGIDLYFCKGQVRTDATTLNPVFLSRLRMALETGDLTANADKMSGCLAIFPQVKAPPIVVVRPHQDSVVVQLQAFRQVDGNYELGAKVGKVALKGNGKVDWQVATPRTPADIPWIDNEVIFDTFSGQNMRVPLKFKEHDFTIQQLKHVVDAFKGHIKNGLIPHLKGTTGPDGHSRFTPFMKAYLDGDKNWRKYLRCGTRASIGQFTMNMIWETWLKNEKHLLSTGALEKFGYGKVILTSGLYGTINGYQNITSTPFDYNFLDKDIRNVLKKQKSKGGPVLAVMVQPSESMSDAHTRAQKLYASAITKWYRANEIQMSELAVFASGSGLQEMLGDPSHHVLDDNKILQLVKYTKNYLEIIQGIRAANPIDAPVAALEALLKELQKTKKENLELKAKSTREYTTLAWNTVDAFLQAVGWGFETEKGHVTGFFENIIGGKSTFSAVDSKGDHVIATRKIENLKGFMLAFMLGIDKPTANDHTVAWGKVYARFGIMAASSPEDDMEFLSGFWGFHIMRQPINYQGYTYTELAWDEDPTRTVLVRYKDGEYKLLDQNGQRGHLEVFADTTFKKGGPIRVNSYNSLIWPELEDFIREGKTVPVGSEPEEIHVSSWFDIRIFLPGWPLPAGET